MDGASRCYGQKSGCFSGLTYGTKQKERHIPSDEKVRGVVQQYMAEHDEKPTREEFIGAYRAKYPQDLPEGDADARSRLLNRVQQLWGQDLFQSRTKELERRRKKQRPRKRAHESKPSSSTGSSEGVM